jgi:vacuolar-type H+-ATPase catalytic subunit A/Vma1
MMQVTGEEGVPLADYVTYQKSLLLDMVYLRQDAYDKVDVWCPWIARKRLLIWCAGLFSEATHFSASRKRTTSSHSSPAC